MTKQEIPAVRLRDALAAAKEGREVELTTEKLMKMLRLDGDRPDGLTLMDRLMGELPTSLFATVRASQ